jgi:hypothetical protein
MLEAILFDVDGTLACGRHVGNVLDMHHQLTGGQPAKVSRVSRSESSGAGEHTSRQVK